MKATPFVTNLSMGLQMVPTGGRPAIKIVLDDELKNRLEHWGRCQLTIKQIAHAMGYVEETLAKQENFQDILDLVNKGRATAISLVSSAVLKAAIGNKEKDPDIQAAKLILTCKGGWTPAQNIHVSGANGGPIQTANLMITAEMPIEQLHDAYNSMLSHQCFEDRGASKEE